jgi:colanic acid/amylovoran biosynthesis glycosyltransferase
MRIGYLASRYPAVSHTFVLREIRALRRAGVEIETFSIHRTPPGELLADVDRQEAGRTYNVLPARITDLVTSHLMAFARSPRAYATTLAFAVRRATPGLRGRLWGLFYFVEAIAVWRAARRRGVRHLHAIFADGASDVALLVACYGGASWSFSIAVHGPIEFYDVAANHLAEKLAAARFAVAISDFGRSQLMTLTARERWRDLHVVRCGIDPDEFAVGSRERSDGAGAEIICVGRLIAFKGQSLLLEACAELVGRGLPAHLTLVGAGAMAGDLQRLSGRLGISDRVRFTGAVGQDDLRALYDAADIFCLPSLSEGLPVVLMEALALELPVVTTRIMGIGELVEDQRTGLLVAPGRADQVADALERLIGDPELRARLGAAGREKVIAQYDVSRSAARLASIFTAALEGSG